MLVVLKLHSKKEIEKSELQCQYFRAYLIGSLKLFWETMAGGYKNVEVWEVLLANNDVHDVKKSQTDVNYQLTILLKK